VGYGRNGCSALQKRGSGARTVLEALAVSGIMSLVTSAATFQWTANVVRPPEVCSYPFVRVRSCSGDDGDRGCRRRLFCREEGRDLVAFAWRPVHLDRDAIRMSKSKGDEQQMAAASCLCEQRSILAGNLLVPTTDHLYCICCIHATEK
jgi:hypothetical protein